MVVLSPAIAKLILENFVSRGFQCVWINESFASQKCPPCHHFAPLEGDKGFRIKYCHNCNIYSHRDLMASEKKAIILRSMLLKWKDLNIYRDTRWCWIREKDISRCVGGGDLKSYKSCKITKIV